MRTRTGLLGGVMRQLAGFPAAGLAARPAPPPPSAPHTATTRAQPRASPPADLRYPGILVQDAAFMVTVPFFCPDVPYLTNNPVFLYCCDRFQRPNPFRADVVVGIDVVIEKKVAALETLVSQFYEGGAGGTST